MKLKRIPLAHATMHPRCLVWERSDVRRRFLCYALCLCFVFFPILGNAGKNIKPARPEPVAGADWFAAFDRITKERAEWIEEDIGGDVGWTRAAAELYDGQIVVLAHEDVQAGNIAQVLVRPNEAQKIDEIQANLHSAGVGALCCLTERQEEEAAGLIAALIQEASERNDRAAKGEFGRFTVGVEVDAAGNLNHILIEDVYGGK